jgi:uncharacterized membrane protein
MLQVPPMADIRSARWLAVLAVMLLAACNKPAEPPDAQGGSPVPGPEAAGKGEPPAGSPGPSISYVALGNEPSWSAKINGNMLLYTTPDDPEGKTYTVERKFTPKGIQFLGVEGGKPFVLDIRGEACEDTMSGQKFAFTATFDYAGRKLAGCARPAN